MFALNSLVLLFCLQTVAQEFDVQAMPTFVYMKGEEKLDKVVGAAKEEIEAKLLKHSQVAAAWLSFFFFFFSTYLLICLVF